MSCNVCGAELNTLLYESDLSLTSLCELFPQPTRVRLCHHCGHVQTDEITDAAAFYDTEYTILTESEEEDQIYEVRDGRKIYRTDHQLDVLQKKLQLHDDSAILDYGCAKSSMMRALQKNQSKLKPFLFDVSDRYVPFWETFCESSNWATYELPSTWTDRFDFVTSFFSLEHMTRPAEIVAGIVQLLKPGGVFYGVVPNAQTNSADLLVIDHVNHFTATSLDCLLTSAGLEVQEIDAQAHRGAYVFVAKRPVDSTNKSWVPSKNEVDASGQALNDIADFWSGAAARLRKSEQETLQRNDIAIYGAGFYGAFIKSCLQHPTRIRCFIDGNPFLQGKTLDGIPIVAPGSLPPEVRDLFVGLNPAYARKIIEGIPEFSSRSLSCVYI